MAFIPHTAEDVEAMLAAIGVDDLQRLFEEIPARLRIGSLERAIGLARVPVSAAGPVQVEIRGRLHAARIVKPPFVRHGKSLID